MADPNTNAIPWGKLVLTTVVLWITAQVATSLFGGPTPEGLLNGSECMEHIKRQTVLHSHKRIIKVIDGVHVAFGYGLGNSIMIEAPEGVIIIDTTESLAAAREIAAAFRNITDDPVIAIIYTHYHYDHINGATAFVESTEDPPEIWAHELFTEQLKKTQVTNTAHFKRSMRQFGPFLPEEVRQGVRLEMNAKMAELGTLTPTKFLRGDSMDVNIAGLPVKLIHIPGETADHMGVWIPSIQLLLSGDNIYQAFPNLYALRGSTPRDTMTWVQSLDKMRKLQPQILVPSHVFPVHGKEKIATLLRDYRDAIQFVHDQTVRYINRGFHPDDIVPHVNLPDELRTHSYLKETYGTVRWSVKGVYSSYMGWFSGGVEDIEPISTVERAQKMIQLAGGVGSLASAAQKALDKGDHRWALELATHIFRLNPDHGHAKQIRLESIKTLAAKQTSSNGRNYFLTTALEDHNLIENKIPEGLKVQTIKKMPLKDIFRTMALKLKAEEVEGQHKLVVFSFSDLDEAYSLELRHSIIDINQGSIPENYDIMVTLESTTWRNLVTGEISPLKAYLKGDIVIEGGLLAFRQFMNNFEKSD